MSVWAILLAGGTGSRFNQASSKLLAPLGNHCVLWHTVNALMQAHGVDGICVVSHPQWVETYQQTLAEFTSRLPFLWTTGGPTRRDSVWEGLCALPPEAQVVMVHDAARPLVSAQRLEDVLSVVTSGQAQASSLGLPVPYTIKQVAPGEAPWVTATVPRQNLWQVNTPQVFQVGLLRQAHQAISPLESITDDAELVERLHPNQPKVWMVHDDPTNLKITTPTDLTLAEVFLKGNTN